MALPTLSRNQPRASRKAWDDAPIVIATVIVRGEHIEGRGPDREAALHDLVDRLSERLEDCDGY